MVKALDSHGNVTYDVLNLFFVQGVPTQMVNVVEQTAAGHVLGHQEEMVVIL
jgi:hypothetical protein